MADNLLPPTPPAVSNPQFLAQDLMIPSLTMGKPGQSRQPVNNKAEARTTIASLECPQYAVNMAMDFKFEEDGFNIDMHWLMGKGEFGVAMRNINVALQDCRATGVDRALLFAGAGMLPLIPWAIRDKMRKKRRKDIMMEQVKRFNASNPELFMRWETRPEKRLFIYQRADIEE